MKDLIIVGASGFGRELLHVVGEINGAKPTWNVLGFIDDNPDALDGMGLQHRILGPISGWEPSGNELYALGIANPATKEKIVPSLKARGASFATILAPGVSVGTGTNLGEGVVSFGLTGISVNVNVGDFVFFNAMVGIGHDVTIGDYCTFGPKACISGGTKLGRCVNVGALASTYPGIAVGDYATIGMNSAAIRRVRPHATVVGVPAKTL